MRESEEDYRRLTELSPDGIFVVDGDRIVFVNSAGLRLLGASHVDQIVGRPVLDFIHPEDQIAIKNRMQSTFEGKRLAQWMEQRAVRLDGERGRYRGHRSAIRSSWLPNKPSNCAGHFRAAKRPRKHCSTSEQRQKAILDAVPDLAWLKDKEGRYLAVNSAWCRFFGMNSTDTLGKTAFDLLAPELAAKFEELDRSIVLSGHLSPYEELLTDKDGRKVWFETFNSPVLDEHGEFIGTTGLARDITERKHAEELLRENEERLRLAAQAANFGTYDYDLVANKLYWSPELKAIWGLRPDDPYPIAEEYVPFGVHPDDRAKVGNLLKESLNPQGSGLLQIEHRIVRPDGSVRWVLAHGRVYFSGDGEARHAVRAAGTFLDITERKQAEESLRKSEASLREAQEVACLGFYVVDIAQGRWTSSEVLDRILDVPTDYAWTEERWGGLVHPDERQSMLDYFRNEVLEKHEPFDREYRIVRYGDKQVRWVHGLGRPEFDAAGHPIGVLGTIQDITERKQAEEALRKSEARYRSLFESNLDGIFLSRPNGVIEAANSAACAMFGMSREEIIRVGRAGLIDPNDPRLPAFLEKRDQLGKINAELTHIHKDGRKFPVEVSVVVLDDDDGQQQSFVMLRDITERKRATESLRESEERLKNVLNTPMVAVGIGDVTGRVKEVNDAFVQLLGYSREELLSGSVTWVDLTPPEYAELDRRCVAELESTGHFGPYEKENIRKDGTRVPILVGAARLPGPANEHVAFIVDITERKHLEQEKLEMERRLLHAQKLESLGILAGGIAHDFNNILAGIMGYADLAKVHLSPSEPAREDLDIIKKAVRTCCPPNPTNAGLLGQGQVHRRAGESITGRQGHASDVEDVDLQKGNAELQSGLRTSDDRSGRLANPSDHPQSRHQCLRGPR